MNYQLSELMNFESEEDNIIADFRESAFGLMQQNQGEEPAQVPLSSMAMMPMQGQPMIDPTMMPPQMIGQQPSTEVGNPTQAPEQEAQGLNGESQYIG